MPEFQHHHAEALLRGTDPLTETFDALLQREMASTADEEPMSTDDDKCLNEAIEFLDYLENRAYALGDIPELFDTDMWVSFQVELYDDTNEPAEFLIVQRDLPNNEYQHMLLIKDVADYPDEPYILVLTGALHLQEFASFAQDLVTQYMDWKEL